MPLTREEALSLVGRKVIYRAPHVPPTQSGEIGVIVAVGNQGAFVRYGAQLTPKLTPLELLEADS